MTHTDVLTSDQPIPTSHGPTRCITCHGTALRYWPCVRLDPKGHNSADPYCETCLVEAKTKLEIALGSASPID